MCLAAGAAAHEYVPPPNHMFAGLTGGSSIVPYERMVGKHPPVFEDYMTWDTPTAWLWPRLPSFRARLGLHMSTNAGYGQAGVISPQGIAQGYSDWFLVDLNRNLAHSKRIFYIRIMGEPNGYWNPYAAYNADGSYRGTQNSPTNYKLAWRRTVLILRGGRVARINRLLRNQGLPPIHARLHHHKRLRKPKVAFVWAPQDAGSPDIPENAPWRFWPGSDYADWVGTDFYSSYPNFAQLSSFYNEFWQRPFVLSEWSVYGADDPSFVHSVMGWARGHARVWMLNYYEGFTSGGLANPAHYPASVGALRQELSSRLFLAYPPEYAHPRHNAREARAAAEQPPLPPIFGVPPGPPPAGP